MTDLTAATITTHFDNTNIISSRVIAADLDLVFDKTATAEEIADEAVEMLMIAGPVIYDHATNLDEGDDWSTPHLFLNEESVKVDDVAVTAHVTAWAGTWDEDADTFRDEQAGADVIIFVPYTTI